MVVEILQLEAQKQNEEAELISMVERNMKEINRLHHQSKKEFKEGMDKINDKHDIIASLKVRIITVVSVIHSKFLRRKYSEVDMQASTGKHTCLRLHSNNVKVKVFTFKIFLNCRCHYHHHSICTSVQRRLHNFYRSAAQTSGPKMSKPSSHSYHSGINK